MSTIYKNEADARHAAEEYKKAHGGVIFDGVEEELYNERDGFVGVYSAIVVGTGVGTEPFGDKWETFYHE